MSSETDRLTTLSKTQRESLEALLLDFDVAWFPDALARCIEKLPSDDHELRHHALLELVKIDLERQWKAGNECKAEDYLKRFPELGTTATVGPVLLLAEYQARQMCGHPVEPEDFGQRFLQQADRLKRRLEKSNRSPSQRPSRVAPTETSHEGEMLATHGDSVGKPQSLPRKWGRYRILKLLGEGGMGTVYLAHDTELDREVALKVPKFSGGDDLQLLERFDREARAAAKLQNRHICPVHDVGEIDGVRYISMVYIHGRPLSAYIRTDRTQPERSIVSVVGRLAYTLQEAHAEGIVHRDLKPANIMIDQKREPVIMDFGLARLDDQRDSRLTQSGMLLGTPAYMSPEQVSGDTDRIGPATDIYSLGVILYELLTGHVPFEGPTASVLGQVMLQEPRKPSEWRTDLDPRLEQICLKMMAKQIEDRYGSMQEVAGVLADYSKHPASVGPADALGIGEMSASHEGNRDLENMFATQYAASSASEIARIESECKPLPGLMVSRRRRRNRSRMFVATAIGVLVLVALGVTLQQTYRQVQKNQVAEKVNILRKTEGIRVRLLIEDLARFPDELVKEALQDQIRVATELERLPLAFALSEYGDVPLDFLLEQVREASGEDVNNFVLALRHSPDDAESALRSLAQQCAQTGDWVYKTRLAVLGLYLGDTSTAAEMLRSVPDTTRKWQRVSNPLDRLRQQLVSIAEMPAKQQNDPQIRLQRAIAYHHLNRPQEALEDVNVLVAARSASPRALMLRALCLAQAGFAEQAAAAVAKLEEAGKDKQDTSFVRSGRILTLAWLGSMEKARLQLESLLIDGKDDALTQYNGACVAAQLARIQADANPDEATRLKRRALGLLRRAYQDLGYKGEADLDSDPDFAPLNDDAEFQALVLELKFSAQEFDPVERTMFIREFPSWCGEVENLTGTLRETGNPHLRSGMCLAIGSIDRPSEKTKRAWQRVFTPWYSRAADSGTHSAAGWVLRQWSFPVPQDLVTKEPSLSRDWWHVSDHLLMVRIPAGHLTNSFTSSEAELTRVNEFWLSDREISERLFRQFLNDKEYGTKYPDELPLNGSGGDSIRGHYPLHPVQQVSWYDAVMFCNWLSRRASRAPCYVKDGKETVNKGGGQLIEYDAWTLVSGANGFRLPTEVEWEYACRAGTSTKFYFGDEEPQLADYGWYVANSESRTHTCGEKLCNAWGLFDMHGNVSEWCQDWYLRGSLRVFRGGGKSRTSWYCESSHRGRNVQTSRLASVGFRVARGVEPAIEQKGPRELYEDGLFVAALEAIEGEVADDASALDRERQQLRGHILACLERWPEAIADFLAVRDRQPDDADAWHKLASAQLAGGQMEEYRGTCRDMVKRFSSDTMVSQAHSVFYACVPESTALDDWTGLVQLAYAWAKKGVNWQRTYAAVLLRSGAHELAKRAYQPPDYGQHAWDYFLLAVIHYRCGDLDRAQRQYDEGIHWVKRRRNWLRVYWWERIETEALQKEAAELLGISFSVTVPR